MRETAKRALWPKVHRDHAVVCARVLGARVCWCARASRSPDDALACAMCEGCEILASKRRGVAHLGHCERSLGRKQAKD